MLVMISMIIISTIIVVYMIHTLHAQIFWSNFVFIFGWAVNKLKFDVYL